MISLIMPPKTQVCVCWAQVWGALCGSRVVVADVAAVVGPTSMLALIPLCHVVVCAVLQLPGINKMLADEYGTASNIKSRVNRCASARVLWSVVLCGRLGVTAAAASAGYRCCQPSRPPSSG